MNILFVCSYYKPAYVYGGPVNAMSSLCEGLNSIGANVNVFTTNANGRNNILSLQTKTFVNVDGVQVRYFPLFNNKSTFFYSPELIKSIIRYLKSYDIAIAEGLWSFPMIATGFSCLLRHIPYVVPIYGQLNPWALSKKNKKKKIYLFLIAKYFLNRSSSIHCETHIEAESIKNLGFNSPNIIVPSCIDTKKIENLVLKINFRELFQIANDSIVLLFLGRLTRIKRPDIAIDTLAELKKKIDDSHLIIAGPDEDGMKSSLIEQAKSLGCAKNIHFTGLLDRESVMNVLAITDLFLMPTEVQENFGNSALEALALGVPIVVSNGVPLGKWAEEYGAGRQVECSTEAFQKAVTELISIPQKFSEMGIKGKTLVKENFDNKVVARLYLSHLESIINNGRPMNTSYMDNFS